MAQFKNGTSWLSHLYVSAQVIGSAGFSVEEHRLCFLYHGLYDTTDATATPKSSADGVKASLVVPGYDLTGTFLPPSCENVQEILSYGKITYAPRDTDLMPKTFYG